MPKPRNQRSLTSESIRSQDQQDIKNPAPDSRGVTDLVDPSKNIVPRPYLPGTSEEKKISKLGKLKSKLSFKDLRKETDKQNDISSAKSTMQARRIATTSGLPAFSSSTQSSKSKSRPKVLHSTRASSTASSITDPSPKPSISTTRAPSPPVACVNAQGTMASTKLPTIRTSQPPDSRPKSGANLVANESPKTPTSSPSTASMKDEDDRAVPGAWPPTPAPKEPVVKKSRPSTYATPINLAPSIDDLGEGDGKVKYLPRSWLEETPEAFMLDSRCYAPSRTSNNDIATSFPNYVPSVNERLEQSNIPARKSTSSEGHNHGKSQVDDIVDIVRSIQRQSDSGIASLGHRVEELSDWVGGQLKSQIENISDVGRTNAELFDKQCEISREIMKFQLDIRLQIGVMERRMSTFEHDILDDMKSKLKALARSYEDLSKRTDELVEKELLSFDHTHAFIEQQIQNNCEIEKEIAFLKSRLALKTSLFPAPKKESLDALRARKSESSMASTDPLIRKPTVIRALPSGGTHPLLLSANNTATTTVDNKPAGLLPRTTSLSKRGLLKNFRDITSSDLKDKGTEKRTGPEENKKWNLFGFRRSHDGPERPKQGSTKLPWSSSRSLKKTPSNEDITSSRASTPPVPPIPRDIPELMKRKPTPPISAHPAFRDSQTSGDSHDTSYETAVSTRRASLPKRVSRSFDASSSPPFPDQAIASVEFSPIAENFGSPPSPFGNPNSRDRTPGHCHPQAW
ncbi:hypothetical protein N7470_003506 [Penicillium chermesinum]|nr:hypothetical protein N7470_003506 [Penicillium chermesinum]